MSKMNTFYAFMVAACAFGAVPSVHALDGTIYAGEFCQAWSGVGSMEWGQLGNRSATDVLRVDCPIVRQETEQTLGRGSWVRVVDQNPTLDVSCAYHSIEAFSDTNVVIRSSNTLTTEGTSVNVRALTRFVSIPFAGTTAHHLLTCNIPPTFDGRASKLTTYKTEENN